MSLPDGNDPQRTTDHESAPIASSATLTHQPDQSAPILDGTPLDRSQVLVPSVPGYEIEAELGRGGMGVV